jgi:hypothetical protein
MPSSARFLSVATESCGDFFAQVVVAARGRGPRCPRGSPPLRRRTPRCLATQLPARRPGHRCPATRPRAPPRHDPIRTATNLASVTDAPLYTLAEAAKVCSVARAIIPTRADRGSLQTGRRDDASRLVSHAVLERTGLLAGSELHRLCGETPASATSSPSTAGSANAPRLTPRPSVTATLASAPHWSSNAIAYTARARAARARLATAGRMRAWRLAGRHRQTRPATQLPRYTTRHIRATQPQIAV